MDVARQTIYQRCLQATREIRNECLVALGQSSADNISPGDSFLSDCESGLLAILAHQAAKLIEHAEGGAHHPAGMPTHDRLEDLLSMAYRRFYAFPFRELPTHWRQLYTDASILKFHRLFLSSLLYTTSAGQAVSRGAEGLEEKASSELDPMVEVLDLALIRAGGCGKRRGKKWIDGTLEMLEQAWHDFQSPVPHDDALELPAKRIKLSQGPVSGSPIQRRYKSWDGEPCFAGSPSWEPPVSKPIERTTSWTIDKFEQYANSSAFHEGPPPLIFTADLAEWPALTSHPWNKPGYLRFCTFGGRRLVPVEIGRSYVDAGWGQEVITFTKFLTTYIDIPPSSQTKPSKAPSPLITSDEGGDAPPAAKGYLAQHELFRQIPSLRSDIAIPHYCWADVPPHPLDRTQNQPKLDTPAENAWFGPAGTITPLHTDAYHNVLCQVVGRKYVRLYSPFQTEKLQPRGLEGGVDMHNTSEIDVGVVEGWDLDYGASSHKANGNDGLETDQGSQQDNWSEFKKVPYLDCILEPGEMLYIPIGWWHYVRSLSVSFSVSFWWN